MWYPYIIRENIHSIDTWELKLEEVASVEAVASSVGEVAITCSDNLNENGIKTMKGKSEMVTNVKEFDEAYIPIVRNRLLDLEVGPNLTYV